MQASDIRDGMRVLYFPSLNSLKCYRGTVVGDVTLLGGHTQVVRLKDMEPAYGNDTGRPGRTWVPAAAISHITPLR